MKTIEFHWVENTWGFYKNKIVNLPPIERDAEFFFSDTEKEINDKNEVFFVQIENTKKEDLLNEYYTKLKFPYFGFNWDALIDCLGDLEWIEQKDVFIYHKKLPELNQKDMETYLDILRCSVAHWKRYKEHNFEVYFNLKDYDRVQQVVGK